MVSAIISRLVILTLGTLYPAYASYKAVRTKNVKEYVKWMMYWIVFALFCAVETFSDFFLSWFPFYYEFKIIFVLWMLSPFTQGSSFLFKKFVHPQLARREKDIDEMIEQATKQGYSAFVDLGSKGFQVIMKSVVMGQTKLADHLRRSYSVGDIADGNPNLLALPLAGDRKGTEDVSDNRYLEEQGDVIPTKTVVTRRKGSSSALPIVTEEDGEDNSRVASRPSNLSVKSRRQGAKTEDIPSSRQARCKSLPPISDIDSKSQFLAKSHLESKKKYQTGVLARDIKGMSSPPGLLANRPPLGRSLSQDSGADRVVKNAGVRSRQVAARAPLLQLDLETALSHGQEYAEGKLDNLQWQFESDHTRLPPPDNSGPLTEASEVNIKREAHKNRTDGSPILNVVQGDVGSVTLSLLSKKLLFNYDEHHYDEDDDENLTKNKLLNIEELDDQCPTPVAQDSPPALSQNDQEDLVANGDCGPDLNLDNEQLDNRESESNSISDAGEVSELESLPEEAEDSTGWETLSEMGSSIQQVEFKRHLSASLDCDEELSSWSAPGSPGMFMRSKYLKDELHQRRQQVSARLAGQDRHDQVNLWLQSGGHPSPESGNTTFRGVLNSWPSPLSSSPYYFPKHEYTSSKFYSQNFDPFQTWQPPRTAATRPHGLNRVLYATQPSRASEGIDPQALIARLGEGLGVYSSRQRHVEVTQKPKLNLPQQADVGTTDPFPLERTFSSDDPK